MQAMRPIPTTEGTGVSSIVTMALTSYESDCGYTSSCDVEADTGTTTASSRRVNEFSTKLGEFG